MFYFNLCSNEKILVTNVLLCIGNNSIISVGLYLLSLFFFFFGYNMRTEVLQLEGKSLLRTQTEITQPASTKDLHALWQVRSGTEFNHLARPMWLPDLDSPSRVSVLQILFYPQISQCLSKPLESSACWNKSPVLQPWFALIKALGYKEERGRKSSANHAHCCCCCLAKSCPIHLWPHGP